jgi:hypothetical protein
MNVDPLLKNLASLETYPNTKDYRVKVLKGDKTGNEFNVYTSSYGASPVCGVLDALPALRNASKQADGC